MPVLFTGFNIILSRLFGVLADNRNDAELAGAMSPNFPLVGLALTRRSRGRDWGRDSTFSRGPRCQIRMLSWPTFYGVSSGVGTGSPPFEPQASELSGRDLGFGILVNPLRGIDGSRALRADASNAVQVTE